MVQIYIYEFLFQTEPLFNDFLLDWIFPAAIVFILYDFAFGVVGGLYRAGIIRGRDLGALFTGVFAMELCGEQYRY